MAALIFFFLSFNGEVQSKALGSTARAFFSLPLPGYCSEEQNQPHEQPYIHRNQTDSETAALK